MNGFTMPLIQGHNLRLKQIPQRNTEAKKKT